MPNWCALINNIVIDESTVTGASSFLLAAETSRTGKIGGFGIFFETWTKNEKSVNLCLLY